jgi:hypothetical protein
MYTALGHKLRFFKGGKAQFVTVGIISGFSLALSGIWLYACINQTVQ